MNILHTTVEIGLEKPFRALHISDNHISFADERDTQRKRDLAASRRTGFDGDNHNTTRVLQEQLDYAEKNGLFLLHTGDLTDFVSYANLDYAKAALADTDYFMAVGNHEFSLYVGEAFEDVPYKMQSYDLVQAHFKNNLLFDSRILGGINFVAVDDGYYRFDKDQLARMKQEIEKGLPIVLMMHNPLFTPDLNQALLDMGNSCGYCTGAPEAFMTNYDDYRYRQQKPDEDTLAFMDYIYSQPLIKCVLAGHMHYDFDTRLPSGIMQYVTGAGYRECAREITFL